MPAALTALQRADYASAEQILQHHLRIQPDDAEALSVLAVALDQEKKYDEAEPVYQRALARTPRDPALLNNFGNHLVATSKPMAARKTFLQVLNLQAANANALVQLARLALQQKEPIPALGYLDKIPSDRRDRPDAVLLRMQADYALRHIDTANAILARISASYAADAEQSFALGVALASVGQYEKAEFFFSKSLERRPGDFATLYDLGLAASHASHNERAELVLKQAVTQQPENVEVLYDLAAVEAALDKKEDALELLAKASLLAPQRTDVLQLEAKGAEALGYFADATKTWDRYLSLVPKDEAARRERAFAQTAVGGNADGSLTELQAFVGKHPLDPVGHYELGTAEAAREPEKALQELNRALALKSDLAAARLARGLTLYRQGKLEAAATDFELVLKREPKNGNILDRLGETYMALGRTNAGLPMLQQAAQQLPSNSTVLLHLGRALTKAGQPEQAAAVFARCRELGVSRLDPHPAGLVEFMGLSPEEQRARYRAGVEQTIRQHPDNAEAEVRYLGILIEDNKDSDAASVVRTLTTLKLSIPLLTDAVRMLSTGSQYALAKQLLDANGTTESPELLLDAAIAEAHVTGAQPAMAVLDRMPERHRGGDFYLARAELLDMDHRPQEAELSIQKARHANPTEPQLYKQAALLLIDHHKLPEALVLLTEAARALPDEADLRLLHALASEANGNHESCDQQLQSIENRWPEWSKVWAAHALVLDGRQQRDQAQAMRQAAFALGAPSYATSLAQLTPFTEADLLRVSSVLFR